MKILVLGYSRVGKSTAAEILAQHLNTKFANTSDEIVEGLARELNISPDEIRKKKEQYRMQLFQYGRRMQEADAFWPQNVQLEYADILTGLRSPDEVKAAREHGVYDVIIWIDRPGYYKSETDKLTADCADVVIYNDGTIEDLRDKLIGLVDKLRSL